MVLGVYVIVSILTVNVVVSGRLEDVITDSKVEVELSRDTAGAVCREDSPDTVELPCTWHTVVEVAAVDTEEVTEEVVDHTTQEGVPGPTGGALNSPSTLPRHRRSQSVRLIAYTLTYELLVFSFIIICFPLLSVFRIVKASDDNDYKAAAAAAAVVAR